MSTGRRAVAGCKGVLLDDWTDGLTGTDQGSGHGPFYTPTRPLITPRANLPRFPPFVQGSVDNQTTTLGTVKVEFETVT